MYQISALFEEYLARRTRDWLVKVEIDGTEYLNNKIVQFTVENNLSTSDEFTLGTTVISKLTLQLKATDEIAPNARVVPYVALTGSSGVTEWLPLGEFYVDRRAQHKDVWTFECLDKLVFAAVPYVSQLTYPTTMQAVWDEICNSLGYEYDDSVVIDPSYRIPAGPAGFTKLQVMGYIAAANAACVYVSKEGTVRFRRFSGSDLPVVEIPPSEYIRFKQTNPVKRYTRIVAVYDADGSAYAAGSGSEDETLYIDLPWATQAIVNALLARMYGFTYYPVQMDTRGSLPQMELGDRFRYGVKAPEYDITWDAADVAWQDADWTWDGYEGGGGISVALNQVYTFKGGLKLSIDAPSISEQESEFGVDGSLTNAINRLNQNAVKLGKAYYGLTVTREQGLRIQREDGLSELTLNSDVMDWRVNNQSALYFDATARRLKFNGTLEAVDGIFSGDLQAAGGTFTGTLQGVDGIFTGTLQGGTIEIGSGSSIFKADLSGIYLGATAFEDAPFSVDLSGFLYATNAFIAGEIEAESGFIGGWTIESDRLSGAGMIDGGTIIGVEFMTSLSSYPRMDISSAGAYLRASENEDQYLQIVASSAGVPGLQLRDDAINRGVTIQLIGSEVHILGIGSTDLYIGNSDGDLTLLADDIDISSSDVDSGTFLTADGSTVTVRDGLIRSIT